MRTYKLTVSYEGTRYQGWQRQNNTPDTIQEVLEQAVEKTVGYPVSLDASGRTDAGVHAKGQTASIVLRGKIDEVAFISKINEILPEDIQVTEIRLMKNGFHARHNARGKCYEYRIDCREKQDVFARKITCHYPEQLDTVRMREAAAVLEGRHDFGAFTDKKDEKSTIRTICGIIIEEQGEKIRIEYRGTGFMYHMVRILTGSLLEVGTGKKTVEDVKRALKSGKRDDAGFLAPAKGLTLKEVYYEGDWAG